MKLYTEEELLKAKNAELEVNYKHGFVDGYNKAKETLYTEEQVMGAMDFARGLYANLLPKDMTDTQFIQSLKKD